MTTKSDILSTIKHDFLASIVVFLVALPLCMGIAIASGAPVAAGLITGIVGGIVTGALAGCPLQVSGPAAGLTVIVYEVIHRFGLEALGVIVLTAGLMQITAGIFRLGQWFRAVSPAVIKGMLAGIGILIFASQFHVMVDDTPKGSGLQNLVSIPQAIVKAIGVPELNGRESRVFRTTMLRKVGEIHRRQVAIYERLAERVPHAAGHPERVLSESKDELAPEALQDVLNEQKQIVSELLAAGNQLEEFEATDKNTERAQRIRQAAQIALEKCQAALAALENFEINNVLTSQQAAVVALEEFLASQKNHHLAGQVGLATIIVLLLWQFLAPSKLEVIPAPLVAVVFAAVVSAIVAIPVLYVEVPDRLWEDLHFPSWTVLQTISWPDLLQTGLLIAAVASAETLLCATAVDQMHQGSRTRYDKELIAQGVGNAVCGFLGALPMTGVIVRSSANVHAGARTRLSAILHGIWLLIFVAFLSSVLRQIPTASLAAILVYTGYKLVNPKSVQQLLEYGWGEVAIYAITVATIVITDLLTGVLVGIALAAVKLLHTFSHLDVELKDEEDRLTLVLKGAATFVRLPKLASVLERVPPQAELHVDFTHLDYIDHACLDLLMNWAKQHDSTGGKLMIDWESLRGRFSRANGRANEKVGS